MDVDRAGSPVYVAGDGTAPDGGLLVVDSGAAPEPHPGRLDLVLADAAAVPPPGADVVDLRPLPVEAVRAIVADYVPAEHLDEATAHVLERSGGWPGPAHEEALRGWQRRRTRRAAP